MNSAPGNRRASRPNVVLIVLDDLGFAQLGCFGSDLDTPQIDRLAQEGLRYNRFHVTALCSPTRASILTGRNHHRVGMGWLTEVPGTAPGYSARIPPTAGTLPRMLRDSGYSTLAVGKWHLTPTWERSAAGPFDRWPLGMGFERFYGFLAAETNQWCPDLVADNSTVSPPVTPFEGYHLTEDLADHAIRFVQDQQQARPGRPFFLYFAPGAMHAPHHVPEQWSDLYRGTFDAGWEQWREAVVARQQAIGVVPRGTTPTPRPSWVQPCPFDGSMGIRACSSDATRGFPSATTTARRSASRARSTRSCSSRQTRRRLDRPLPPTITSAPTRCATSDRGLRIRKRRAGMMGPESLAAADGNIVRWFEQDFGGTVVEVAGQTRWRPVWFATVDRGGTHHELVVRGDRTDMPLIFPLKHEMTFQRLLGEHGIPVATVRHELRTLFRLARHLQRRERDRRCCREGRSRRPRTAARGAPARLARR